jgi:site-specific DNA recombinase
VQWIFAERLAGHSIARIARALNDAGIPCPSAADPKRNPHRTGTRRTLRTVAAILANPRYTGRQVWNRQRTDHDLIDPANTTLGHKAVQRWNLPTGWVISKQLAHPALVSEHDFIAVQNMSAPRGPGRPSHSPVSAGRAAAVWPLRAAAGIGVVQRQARLPVPPRLRQRHPPRP